MDNSITSEEVDRDELVGDRLWARETEGTELELDERKGEVPREVHL